MAKALGATEQRNLPSGYTQVEYLGSDSQAYIDTGISGGANDLEIGCKFRYTKYVMYGAVYGNWIYDTFNVTRLILGFRNNEGYLNNNSLSNIGGNTDVDLSMNTIHTLVSQYTTYTIDGITKPITMTGSGTTNDNNIVLFNRSVTNPNTSRDIGLEVYSFYIKKSGVLVRNLIPARRNSDSVLGMYDTVSQTFFTNAGTGTFTAGADVTTPSPDTPMDIICNNGVLKVSRNLFDKNGEFIEFNTAADYIGIPVPNGTYTCSTNIPQQNVNDRNAWFDNQNETFSSTVNGVSNNNSRTVTTSNGYVYFAIRKSYKSGLLDGTYWVQIEKGSTATPYAPYSATGYYTDGTQETVNITNGGTANAEMLLKVGNYQDNHELLTGNVTRNVGIKVLDGTENWQKSGSYAGAFFFPYSDFYNPVKFAQGVCTHARWVDSSSFTQDTCYNSNSAFIIWNSGFNASTSLEQFKSWLATQYANGTPVIVVYPLATPTTETVTGQPLTASGNCTVTATGSLDNLSLEVSYKAAAQVTITEVQNSQLSNNVEVTIND